MLVATCALQHSSVHVCVRSCYAASEDKHTFSHSPTCLPGRSPHGDTHPALHAQLATHGSDRAATKRGCSVYHQSTPMMPSLIATKQPHANQLAFCRPHVMRHS